MRRFYAPPEQFQADAVELSAEETRHLRNVLRLTIGDEVHVFDGEGREFLCEITDVTRGHAKLTIENATEPVAPESKLEITLAAAIYKNDKLDLVVQKAVELGAVRFMPFIASRSEARLQDATRRAERWRKIALEATKQCERARIMKIDEPTSFEEFLDGVDPIGGSLLIFTEKDGGSIALETELKKITALVGPKGGWDDSEIEAATTRGFLPIKLGRRIMRAETAAISFTALLQHRFGDLN